VLLENYKKMKSRKLKLILSGVDFLGGGGHKERENEDEYNGCILYLCIKIEDQKLLKLF
jgi:hypothetical protein